jgi:hypothetical protein
MDSLTEIPTPAAAHAADPTYLAAQVLRLEQALAATSKGISDRIAGDVSTAVQVEPEPRPAETTTGDVGAVLLERAKLPEVARLEDVLSVPPPDLGERTATPATNEPADATTHRSVAPPAEALERRTKVEPRAAEPAYVAAQALREAFWFEQAAAFRPIRCEEDPAPQAPQAVMPVAEPAVPAADAVAPAADRDTHATNEGAIDVEPAQTESGLPPTPPQHSSRGRWVAAVWVLALIALVALLTGRGHRRSI